MIDASAGEVTLVGQGAGHADAVIDAGAASIGADVARGAGVAVNAGRAIQLVRVRAGARRVVASAGEVALVERRARHLGAWAANAGLARIR